MKKCVFVTLFLAFGFLIVSCQLSYPNDTILTNHSSRVVTVNLARASTITLALGESASIATCRYMNPRERMQSFSPNQRVYFVYTNSTLTFEFFDRDRYEVRILNLSRRAGVLSAGGWMNNASFGAQNTEQTSGWFVYTRQPEFTARAGNYYLPVLSPRQVGNVFFVTIGLITDS